MVPSMALYWHMGATTMRLLNSKPPSLIGWNNLASDIFAISPGISKLTRNGIGSDGQRPQLP
jgi:hypothetical protein